MFRAIRSIADNIIFYLKPTERVIKSQQHDSQRQLVMGDEDPSHHFSTHEHHTTSDGAKAEDRGDPSYHVFTHEYRELIDTTEQPHIYTHEHFSVMNSNEIPDTPLPGQTFSGSTSPRQLSRSTAATPSHAHRTVHQAANPLRRSPERDAMLAAVANRTNTPPRQSQGTPGQALEQKAPEYRGASQGPFSGDHLPQTQSQEQDMPRRRRERGMPNLLEGRPNLLAPPANAPSTPLSPYASPFYGTGQQQSALNPSTTGSQGTINPPPTGPRTQGAPHPQNQSPQVMHNAPNQPHAESPHMTSASQQDSSTAAQYARHNTFNVEQPGPSNSSPFMNPNIQHSPFIAQNQPCNPAFNAQTPGNEYATPYTHASPGQQQQNSYTSPQEQQHQSQPPTPYTQRHPHRTRPRLPTQNQPQDPHSNLSTPRPHDPYPIESRVSSTPINLGPLHPEARKEVAKKLLATLEQDKKMLIQKRKESFSEIRDLEGLIANLKGRRDGMMARRDWSGSSENESGSYGGGGGDGRGIGGGGVGRGGSTPTMPAAMRAMITAAGNTTPSRYMGTITESPQQLQYPQFQEFSPGGGGNQQHQAARPPSLGQQIWILEQELLRVEAIHDGYGNMVKNVEENIEEMWDAVVGLEGLD